MGLTREIYFGIAEILVGYSLVFPAIVRMIPPIRRKFELLSDRDQNLFLRKCVSIVHCWFICSVILYLQFNPALCQEGWSKFSQIWIGFLWTDLFVGLLTKTAGFDDICHHILYGFVHLMIYKLDAGCFAFGILQFRYYADFFNQNMQLRLMLAMFGLKKSSIYFWNNRIACWGFFLVRIAVIPIAWYHFYLHSTDFYMYTENIYYFAPTIIMLILSDWQNINWFSRLYASCYTSKRIKKN